MIDSRILIKCAATPRLTDYIEGGPDGGNIFGGLGGAALGAGAGSLVSLLSKEQKKHMLRNAIIGGLAGGALGIPLGGLIENRHAIEDKLKKPEGIKLPGGVYATRAIPHKYDENAGMKQLFSMDNNSILGMGSFDDRPIIGGVAGGALGGLLGAGIGAYRGEKGKKLRNALLWALGGGAGGAVAGTGIGAGVAANEAMNTRGGLRLGDHGSTRLTRSKKYDPAETYYRWDKERD